MQKIFRSKNTRHISYTEVLALSHQCECVSTKITSITEEHISRNRLISWPGPTRIWKRKSPIFISRTRKRSAKYRDRWNILVIDFMFLYVYNMNKHAIFPICSSQFTPTHPTQQASADSYLFTPRPFDVKRHWTGLFLGLI